MRKGFGAHAKNVIPPATPLSPERMPTSGLFFFASATRRVGSEAAVIPSRRAARLRNENETAGMRDKAGAFKKK